MRRTQGFLKASRREECWEASDSELMEELRLEDGGRDFA